MSRIGKRPLALSPDVQAQMDDQSSILTLKKGGKSLQVKLSSEIKVEIKDQEVLLKRKNEQSQTKAFHGLYHALIKNAVIGLTKGWSKQLSLVGVGYKALVSGKNLQLHLGYSKPILLPIPEGIDIKVEKQTKLLISGIDRQKVGQTAAFVRSLRPPEPYLGKGVKYSDEVIRKKAGKSGAEKKA